MAALILHSGDRNKNAFKALIAAEYCGAKVLLAKNFEMGVTNRTPEFIKMNPLGKVPVLETPDGAIFESNAIARYVARSKGDNLLFGDSLIQHGRVEQWIDFATTEVDSNIARWLYPRLGFMPFVPASEEISIAVLKRSLGALNTYLASCTFLVGNSVTLADIVMTCNLYSGFAGILNKDFTSQFPHVERYFWTMVNQPNFKKIIGDVKQAEAVPAIRRNAAPAKPKEVKKAAPKETQNQWLRNQRKRHQSQSPKIPLIYCHQARWFLMIGRGCTQTQRATSTRLPLKVSGTCMTQRVTLCGSVSTSTKRRTPCHM